MLQTKAVKQHTFALLKELMSISVLNDFSLAGGTGLALQLGHRFSEDIDLFSENEYDENQALQALRRIFNIEIILKEKNSLSLLVNDVKVDILSYQYPLLEDIINDDGIRIYSIPDIAAMKLSAISSRGSKKDFYDIYFILKKFSLEQILNFYCKKFSTKYYYHVLKSLVYFQDAETEPDPVLINSNIGWVDVKDFMERIVENFIKSKKKNKE